MTAQTAHHDHTTAYLLIGSVILIVLAIGGAWMFAS
jgi:hypothetical protein